MLLLGAHDPRLNQRGHHAEATVAQLIRDSFGGPLAGDRWIAFYGIHVRQMTLPQEGEELPEGDAVDQLRELDFLVFDRKRGFAVLEVKGGLLRVQRGAWERLGFSEDADPAIDRKTWIPANDPMAQARSAMADCSTASAAAGSALRSERRSPCRASDIIARICFSTAARP